MGKTLDEVPFVDLLPGSIAGDATIKAAAESLDAELRKTTAQARALALLSRIEALEEPLLSVLAWQFHVDYWPDTYTIEEKRRAVKNSIIRHMQKGTPAAVEAALAEVIAGGTVTEWYEYGGDPGYFRVETTGSLGDAETFGKRLLPNIDASKNTRSWLDRITVRREFTGRLDLKLMMAKSHRHLAIGPRLAMDLSIRPRVALVPMTHTQTTIAVRQ